MPQNTPSSLSDFAQQAKSFVAKAKDAGKSNTAIANTINFMFTMFQLERDEQNKLKDTQWLDTDGDGIEDTLVDNQTGETISSFNTSETGSIDDFIFETANGGESNYDELYSSGDTNETTQSGDFTQDGGLSIENFAQNRGAPEQPTTLGDEALKKISEIDSPARKDPVTGEEVRDVDLSGLNLQPSPGFFSQFTQQPDLNKLSLGGFQLPKIRL